MATEPETSRDRLLYEVAADLTSTLDLDQVLRTLIDKVIDLMNASRGFIVLVEDGVMRVRMARSESGSDPSVFEGSRTVVEQVVATATAVITTDAISDDRFKGQQSVILRNLRSIIAVPLIVRGEVIGAVYVDNPFKAGLFEESDKEFLQALAHQAAIAIENARLYTQLKSSYEESEHMRRIFERYVNKQVMERVLSDPKGDFLAGEKLKVTMLASDIAGFSKLSHAMEPEKLVALLNDYFRLMVDIVLSHGGNIDKFQGDGLLVVFGAPVPVTDSAARAVGAASDMIKAIRDINKPREAAGLAPINVGFGLDSGYVVGGNIGSERRLEYTLIGVPVNNAAYLSKIRPPDVFVSQNTFLELKAEAKTTPRDPMILKGAVDPIPIYSLDVD
ncbi:MAG: GAF domain-containing protein [Chloroflexi bacterium]|nr:MAG: GAF domain-containing protein [Chloroflexota bacterium]TME15487.1 MAG: GAF domain-containing protein [Chloroflexota bacterium]TME16561.1 MAG: GAF domain-containing protein [Chloroflexota bacterium]